MLRTVEMIKKMLHLINIAKQVLSKDIFYYVNYLC